MKILSKFFRVKFNLKTFDFSFVAFKRSQHVMCLWSPSRNATQIFSHFIESLVRSDLPISIRVQSARFSNCNAQNVQERQALIGAQKERQSQFESC